MTSRSYVITAILLAAACGRRHTPDDTLVFLTDTEMSTVDPRMTLTSVDSRISRLATAGLTVVQSDSLEPELDLATRIDRIDDVTFDVAIRTGAKFSDGSPLTAHDVVATYRSVYEPGSKSQHHKLSAERFKLVEARGDHLVRFHLHQPLATLLSDLDFGILSARAIAADGYAYTGPYSGPYAVRELSRTRVVLEANPYYFGPPPKTPRLELKCVVDAGARLLMLIGGSADVIQNAARLDLLDEIRRQPGVQLASKPSVILSFLMMNNEDPVLRDHRVREAIAHALDRPALIATKFGGRARIATGLLPDFHWAYESNVAKYDYDPARTAALLDAAGYPDPDGPGPRPRLTLVYKTSADPFRVTLARVIAAQLERAGIAIELRSFEWGTFFADVKKGSYQLATMQSNDISEPDWYYTYFHSSRIPTAKNPDPHNRWRYSNPRVDWLTEQGRREVDRDKRKALYGEVQRIIAADLPMIALWHEDNVVLSNERVQGYQITPNARLIGLTTAWKRSESESSGARPR